MEQRKIVLISETLITLVIIHSPAIGFSEYQFSCYYYCDDITRLPEMGVLLSGVVL